MKRLLNYSRHWFRSQGRHGTHSPFVYAFVEQVLRNKNKIKTEQVKQLPVQALSLREQKLLYKTLYFLKPQQVLIPEGAGLDWIKEILSYIVAGAKTADAETFTYTADSKHCLLIMPASDAYRPCFEQAIQAGVAVLVVHPHAGEASLVLWDRLYQDQQVKMSLDYWYFGLLMNDIAFKQKQHFRLR